MCYTRRKSAKHNVQVKHQSLDTEIALTLHFCMRSWHELVLLSHTVTTYKGKLHPDSKKYAFYTAKWKDIQEKPYRSDLQLGGYASESDFW